VVKGSKTIDEAKTSHQDENLGKPQVDCLEHVVGHDRDVYMGDDRVVDFDEIFDASVLMEIVTSTEEEGGAFGAIEDDYEGDDTTTSIATLELADGAQDTSTNDGQDNTCVGIAGEDGVEVAPMYEEETYPVLAYDFYYEDEGSTLTYDISCQLEATGKRPFTLYNLEDRLLVTEDQVTQVLTRTDGARRFIKDIFWRAQMEERHIEIVGGVTSAQLCISMEELEQLKSNYLQLFMDMDLSLKFA
jgi:hypothetical protein